MSVEDNKAIIRAYVEMVWNRKQLDRAEEVVASDFIDHAPLPGQAPGLEGAKRKWAMYLTAIPDLRVTIEDLVAEGDRWRCAAATRAPTRVSCWASQPPVSSCMSAASASSAWSTGRSPRTGSSWIGSPCCSSSASFQPRPRLRARPASALAARCRPKEPTQDERMARRWS